MSNDIKAVIFDLDGVILSTDNFHYLAWKKMADREGIYFDREINERLRGVSRMASLEIVLEKAGKKYSEEEKEEMATFKNNYYRDSLINLSGSDIFPGVMDFLKFLDRKRIKTAVGSSSKNAKFIIERIGLMDIFKDKISDGTNISKSKPDPEVFIKAAQMAGTPPEQCLVLEDADAGIEAAKAGNMLAMGLGSAKGHPDADFSYEDVSKIDLSIFE